MRLALYQPDIPQNTGTILRLAACMNIGVDIIGPAGFSLSEKALRRAGLDYMARVVLDEHSCFEAFMQARETGSRLIALTTKATQAYATFAFRPSDTLLFGRESAGLPPSVHETADSCLRIPMRQGLRSLNLAVSVAMVLGEALRQTDGFP